MSVTQTAEKILKAWQSTDPGRFETEIQNSISIRQSVTVSALELEKAELLESVVERLRRVREGTQAGHGWDISPQVGAGLALLNHLSQRPSPFIAARLS